eukprot:6205669-Pleurochrysis_carterae.AAC.1
MVTRVHYNAWRVAVDTYVAVGIKGTAYGLKQIIVVASNSASCARNKTSECVSSKKPPSTKLRQCRAQRLSDSVAEEATSPKSHASGHSKNSRDAVWPDHTKYHLRSILSAGCHVYLLPERLCAAKCSLCFLA